MLSFASAGSRVLVSSTYAHLSPLFYLPSAHKAAHFYPRGCLVDPCSRDTALRISQSRLYTRPSVPFFVPILSFAFAGVGTYQSRRNWCARTESTSDSRVSKRVSVPCESSTDSFFLRRRRRRRRRRNARASADPSILLSVDKSRQVFVK